MTDSHDVWRQLNPVPSNPVSTEGMTRRAALYARAASFSQANGSSSIAEQKRAVHAFCQLHNLSIVAEYIDAPGSGADEDPPEFQRMGNDAIRGVPGFELIVVKDYSRFFRNAFRAEMYRRRLLKAGVNLVSIQEARDEPSADLMRRIISLFDEFSSKENAKYTLRGMEENARQGFVNGTPPFGYRAEVAETRGGTVKKRLEIEPHEAEIVKLVFRLAMIGPTDTGPAGGMAIARELRRQNLRTRSGQPFSSAMVNKILRRTTYVGRHVFNLTEGRTKQKKPPDKRIAISVPAIIDEATFEAVQAAMCERNPFRTRRGSQAGQSENTP